MSETDVHSDTVAEPQTTFLDTALASFILLAKFLGSPADADQLGHERGKGVDRWTLEDLSRTSKRLGLIARIKNARPDRLAAIPLPALAEERGGGAFILLKLETDGEAPRALIQRADAQAPEVLTQAQLFETMTGRMLLLTSRELMAGATRPFDISWFIPALVKYRKPLRDVLIGSFFLQLMGLDLFHDLKFRVDRSTVRSPLPAG